MKITHLAALLLLSTTSCVLYVEGKAFDDLARVTHGREHGAEQGLGHAQPAAAKASADDAGGLSLPTETFTLPNGMTVVLHEDHSLPKVVVNTWYAVGSKDEKPGRTGFAHMFEHLMFMGTGRVPEGQFDILMESGGGWNTASTSNDRTNYYSEGPSSLLPTLLWLDADRYAELANHMTLDKLNAQRAVVRNERRQTTENTPYGIAELIIPANMYPEGHPYHHSVIGSHEDLEAATVKDVVEFFRTYYVPGNASLVVAGDFDPTATRALIEELMGAVPAGPIPTVTTAAPVVLESEKRIVATDRVQFAQLYLCWHSPAAYAPGDAELDIAAAVLSGGPSTRLEKRIVLETGLAQRVRASQQSTQLGSIFQIQALAAPGADLGEIKAEIFAVLEEFKREGPTADELARVKAMSEARFLGGIEDLGRRADLINAYRAAWGIADGFQRDLDRTLLPTASDVRDTVRATLGEGRVDLRIYPKAAAVEASVLDTRPSDFAPAPFVPPTAETFTLSSGIEVHAVVRPGRRLFSGRLVSMGGEVLVPRAQAGLAPLTASMMNSGAGGRDASVFAEAVEALGARIDARADRESFTVQVEGLSSRLADTLDLFADLALRPEMTDEDFAREKSLALSRIQSRRERVQSVASTVANALTFLAGDPRGRSVSGYEETVGSLDAAAVRAARDYLLHPANSSFVFVGDFELATLRALLEERFGDWTSPTAPPTVELTAPTALVQPRIVVVDRPGAPQTMIQLMRPIPVLDGDEWTARACANRVLGEGFTSRLNFNLREDKGYTYGARSSLARTASVQYATASSAVFTDKTGAALTEFKREFDRMAAEGLTADDLVKAVESARTRLIELDATTSSIAAHFTGLLTDGRPLDSPPTDLAALDRVTLSDANRYATSDLFAWNAWNIILVGDRTAITEQLEAAGFPAPVEATTEGALVE